MDSFIFAVAPNVVSKNNTRDKIFVFIIVVFLVSK